MTAGIALTGLTCYGVRNWLFHADAVFLPALSSCALGLLTVLYCFLVSGRYVWNTGALLTTVAAAVSAFVYGSLLVWSHRRISFLKHSHTGAHVPLTSQAFIPAGSTSYRSPNGPRSDPAYYRNFVENMYPGARTTSGNASTVPTSAEPAPIHQPPPVANIVISEEEATRQQMLLLLRDKNGNAITPQPAHNPSYHIDWDDIEGDDDRQPLNPSNAPPQNSNHQHPYAGYYAPSSAMDLSIVSPVPSPAATTPTRQQHLALPGGQFEHGWENGGSLVSQASSQSQSQPFRDGLRSAAADPTRFSRSSMDREARRRQIEMGM